MTSSVLYPSVPGHASSTVNNYVKFAYSSISSHSERDNTELASAFYHILRETLSSVLNNLSSVLRIRRHRFKMHEAAYCKAASRLTNSTERLVCLKGLKGCIRGALGARFLRS